MYENYYGLSEKPFSLLPDPDYLYLSRHHQKALTLLEYGILNQAGFCVISGQAGAGKTTLIRHLLNRFDKDTTIGLLSNTHESFEELLAWILMSFDLPYQNKSKTELYQCFVDFLIDQYAKKHHTVLIIDEAQNMSPAALEELRMLSNVNADKDQLLQMILMGQPKLLQNLQRPELRQFAQRIAVDYRLEAINENETCAYIRHRLKVAGAEADIFDDSACQAVYKHSRGLPRLINLLCDTALVYGYAEDIKVIDENIINDVVKERDENTILPHYHELNEETAFTEIKAEEQNVVIAEDAELELTLDNKITSCGETSSYDEPCSRPKVVAASDNKVAASSANVSPIQKASVTSLKQAEYFSKAMNLQNKVEGSAEDKKIPGKKIPIKNNKNENNDREQPIKDLSAINHPARKESANEPVAENAEGIIEKPENIATSRGAGKFGFIILGFAFGLLLSIAATILYKMDNLNASVVDESKIADRMSEIENNFALKLQAIQQQREVEQEKNRTVAQEKEASLARATALQHERDAALAIAKAREELLQAKLEAEQAMQKERQAKEQALLDLQRTHAAELEANRVKQREQEAVLAASRIKPEIVAQPKRVEAVAEVLPEPFMVDEPEVDATAVVSATTTQEGAPAKAVKAARFTSNPCEGPTAVLISTCKK